MVDQSRRRAFFPACFEERDAHTDSQSDWVSLTVTDDSGTDRDDWLDLLQNPSLHGRRLRLIGHRNLSDMKAAERVDWRRRIEGTHDIHRHAAKAGRPGFAAITSR